MDYCQKNVKTGLEHQVDIVCALKLISPKFVIAAHQTGYRMGVPNKGNNTETSDNINV